MSVVTADGVVANIGIAGGTWWDNGHDTEVNHLYVLGAVLAPTKRIPCMAWKKLRLMVIAVFTFLAAIDV